MNDLVVDDQLPSTIVDDECSDAASPTREGTLDLAEQVVVVDDRQTLLDIAALSHAHKTAVITDVQDAVLLEDWAQHALHIDTWLGVGIE